MSAQPQFSVNVYQNEYLADGASEVNAIVSVQSAAAYGGAPNTRAAQVIMVDCSGSMDYPPTKMSAARQATEAAIDAIRDGVPFAVVAGTHVARMVFPGTEYLVPADASSRAAAKAAVSRLTAGGGTAMGQWLALADRLFTGHDQAIRHAILLTDGKDEHEEPSDLAAALSRCEGRFTCDCRGIGTDWVHAMGKAVGDVRLRVWAPQGARIKFVKQVAPQIADLSARRSPGPNPLTGDYPTGAWGAESRDYQVCVQVRPGSVGDEMLAARIGLVAVDGAGQATVLGQGLVKATWSDDIAQTGRIDRTVADYTGQTELADAIREGLEARKNGDLDTATARLGRAVKLAAESGNEETALLLSKVVDVDDPATGTVRLKSRVSDADEMTLDTRSTRTARVGKNRNGNS